MKVFSVREILKYINASSDMFYVKRMKFKTSHRNENQLISNRKLKLVES